MQKRLKILFLPKWYPNRFDVLDGIYIVDHAKAAALHHDVFLLFIHSDSELSDSQKILIDESKGYKEIVVYFRFRKTSIRFLDKIYIGMRYLFVQLKCYRQLKKEWGQPDVTHVHVLMRSSFLALWLKWTKGIPFVISEHWTGYDSKIKPPINWYKKKLLAFVIKNSSTITIVSKYLEENLRKIYSKANYKIISNAVDENLFSIKMKLPSAKKRIIHISSLDTEQKNFGEILLAIAMVCEQRTDFELNVIGNGNEKDKQVELSEQLGLLGKIVFFHNYLEKEKIAELLSTSDLMILFSNYETQSCVLLESFLCGVPVIATNISGVNEIVNTKNGKLIPKKNTPLLIQAIENFLDNKIDYNSQEIRSEAMIYSYSFIGAQLSEVYHFAIQNQTK